MMVPDESGAYKDFTEKSTEWIAMAGKRFTDRDHYEAMDRLQQHIEVLCCNSQFALHRNVPISF